jgi:Fis family transcriptional regulator, factor for inversion stimulation protein
MTPQLANSNSTSLSPVTGHSTVGVSTVGQGTSTQLSGSMNTDQLFVANLNAVSLEKIVKSKLEVLFQQQKEANVELNGLYTLVMEQVERPLLEIALKAYNGNQVKTAQMLGINRNTLKKKIDIYKIRVKRGMQM